MFNKFFWIPTILSVAGLLTGANSTFAQSRGGHSGGGHSSAGHGGGGHSSAGHSYGGHGSGGHNYGGHGYGGHGYGGYGYGGAGYGGGYYPGIFGGSYPWYDDYTYPRYSNYYAPATEYYTPPTQYYAQPAPVVNNYANIRVIVPDPQARVWFDGNSTSQTGTDRLFNSPSLTIGSTYNYQIRASWMQGGKEVSQERTVSVTPGQTTVVDFTR